MVLCVFHPMLISSPCHQVTKHINEWTVTSKPNCARGNTTKVLTLAHSSGLNAHIRACKQEFLSLCEVHSYFSNNERLAVLQSSFQSESPRRATVQLHMDVLERHQLLHGLHYNFCAFNSVHSLCNPNIN